MPARIEEWELISSDSLKDHLNVWKSQTKVDDVLVESMSKVMRLKLGCDLTRERLSGFIENETFDLILLSDILHLDAFKECWANSVNDILSHSMTDGVILLRYFDSEVGYGVFESDDVGKLDQLIGSKPSVFGTEGVTNHTSRLYKRP
jgi:hypothetical protein